MNNLINYDRSQGGVVFSEDQIAKFKEILSCGDVSMRPYLVTNAFLKTCRRSKVIKVPEFNYTNSPYLEIDKYKIISVENEKESKEIEFLVVNTRVFYKHVWLGGYFLIAKKGELHKVILKYRKFEKQAGLKTKPIFSDELWNVINKKIIKYYKLMKKNKNLINMGIILYGNAGCGKTSLIKYLKSACTNVMCANSDQISRQDIIFWENDCGVYIFDDVSLDFFSKERRPDQASYLLNFMDGESKKRGIFILATNEDIKKIDAPFLRPGRLGIQLKIDNPTRELREKFLNQTEINLDKAKLLDISDGWSFANLAFVRDYAITQKMLGEPFDLEEAISYIKDNKDNQKRIGFAT